MQVKKAVKNSKEVREKIRCLTAKRMVVLYVINVSNRILRLHSLSILPFSNRLKVRKSEKANDKTADAYCKQQSEDFRAIMRGSTYSTVAQAGNDSQCQSKLVIMIYSTFALKIVF